MLVRAQSGFDPVSDGVRNFGGLGLLKHHEESIRRALILAVLYLMPAIWILQPVIIDPDLWWHLQSGKWIVEHGTLPTTDPFSAYGEDKPWIVYSWLFDVGMYGILRASGETGIILCTLIGIWAIMLVLQRIIATRCSNFVVVCLLMVTSAACLTKLFTPRPWLLTILFFAITLEVVLSIREDRNSGWFWFLPVLYILWANTHIQFIYGLGLLGLAVVAPLMDRFAQPLTGAGSPMDWGSPRWKKLLGLTALCTFATLLTPYQIRLYSVVVTYAGQTGMWEYASEMLAPAFRTIADWTMLTVFAVALVRLGWRRSWSSFDLLLLFVAGFSSFRTGRDIWFLMLASLAVILLQDSRLHRSQRFIVPRGMLLPVTAFVAVGVVCFLVFRGFSESKIQENTGKLYPVDAAGFVEQQGYTGPLYNHFDWGGYLIWRLPHLKVSMDGRANVHGDERIKRALATWAGGPHWTDDEELNNAQVVIAQKGIALTAILRLDPRFQVVYQDETAVVFTRIRQSSPQSESPIQERFLAGLQTMNFASAR